MRKEYLKAFRELISAFRASHFPAAEIQTFPLNETVLWLTSPGETRQIGISFVASRKAEAFDVNLIWSPVRKSAIADTADVSAFDKNGPAFDREEHRISLKWLSGDHGSQWEIKPPILDSNELLRSLSPIGMHEAKDDVLRPFSLATSMTVSLLPNLLSKLQAKNTK